MLNLRFQKCINKVWQRPANESPQQLRPKPDTRRQRNEGNLTARELVSADIAGSVPAEH